MDNSSTTVIALATLAITISLIMVSNRVDTLEKQQVKTMEALTQLQESFKP